MNIFSIQEGTCSPLGASVQLHGVNFSVYSRNAEVIELLLFGNEDDAKPDRIIRLDSKKHRTYYYWQRLFPV
jgi:isoamylase